MTKEKIKTEIVDEKKKPLNKKIIATIVASVLALGVIVFFVIVFFGDKTEVDFSRLKNVCELSTLKVQIHDVAVDEETSTFLHLADKRIWIEYEAWVEYGVDASEIKCSQPDKNGVVVVEMPEAKIIDHGLGEVYDEEKNKKENIIAKLFDNYEREDKDRIIQDSQNKILDTVQSDSETNQFNLKLASDNAKQFVEDFIINTGKLMKKDFTVKFK